MLAQKDLKELVSFDAQGHKVLSVYFSTDLTQHSKEERRLALKQLLEPLKHQTDSERVFKYFDQEYDWQSLGVAIFSSTPLNFWREVRMAVPVPDYAALDDKPNVRLLSDLMDEYACYAVALVDRDRARFFRIQLGEIEEFAKEFPAVPSRHKQGGWSAARFQRQNDTQALLNLKQAAQLTSDFVKSQTCSRLLLAGTSDVLAQFRGLLPKSLREKIVGEFAMDMEAPTNQVFEKAREIEEQVERDSEVAQVEAITTAARKKNPTATLGLADTLNALVEGKVYTLVAASDFRAPGFACTNCGYLSAQKLSPCPLCGKEMQQVDNAADMAVRKAIQLGSRIELIRDPAAARLKERGGIGSVLRY